MFGLFPAVVDTPPASPPTRFENSQELAPLYTLIEKLRLKKSELESAVAKKGQMCVDYDKLLVVTRILDSIDERLAKFNSAKRAEDPDVERNHMVALVQELWLIFRWRPSDEYATLAAPRNNLKKVANSLVNAGSIATAIAVSVAVPFTMFGTVAAAIGAKVANTVVRRKTGMTDLTPDSIIFFSDIQRLIPKIEAELVAKLNSNHRLNEDLATTHMNYFPR